MIERHKDLSKTYDKAVNHPDVGNSEAHNPEAELSSDCAMRELIDHAKQLFAVRPSSVAGVAAFLRYISTLKEWQMPGDYSGESELRRLRKLTKSLATALDRVGVRVPAIPAFGDDPMLAAIEAHKKAWKSFEDPRFGARKT